MEPQRERSVEHSLKKTVPLLVQRGKLKDNLKTDRSSIITSTQ